MRNNLGVILGLAFLASCNTAPKPQPTSKTYRQQLDVYKGMKIRLYQVSSPIKIAAANECSQTDVDNGILTHRLADYPQNMRTVAQSYWGLKDDGTVLFEKEPSGIPNCTAPLILDYQHIPNAHTDGESIFITPALLNAVDDLSLALIIAHELAHITLGHMDEEPSEQLERQADRFALFMLARAGLDYKKAARQDAASRRPHADTYEIDMGINMRVDYFRKVIAEIETLQANGEKLVP